MICSKYKTGKFLFLLILTFILSFEGTAENYRVFDPNPSFDPSNYRYRKSRATLRFFADRCLKIDYNYLNKLIISEGKAVKFSEQNYSDFVGTVINSLQKNKLANPLTALVGDIQFNEGKVEFIRDVNNNFLKYRFFATPFLPVDFQTYLKKTEFGFSLSHEKCSVSIYKKIEDLTKSVGNDYLIFLESPLSGRENPFEGSQYRKADEYISDELIFIKFSGDSIGNDDFKTAIALSFFDLEPDGFKDSLTPSKGFLPLAIRNPKYPSKPDYSFTITRLWQSSQLFQTFSRPRFLIPDYPGFHPIAKQSIERMKFSMSIEPVVEYLTSEEIIIIKNDKFELQLGVVNFDSLEMTEILRRNALDEADIINSVTLGNATQENISELYKSDVPVWWIKYPIYRKR